MPKTPLLITCSHHTGHQSKEATVPGRFSVVTPVHHTCFVNNWLTLFSLQPNSRPRPSATQMRFSWFSPRSVAAKYLRSGNSESESSLRFSFPRLLPPLLCVWYLSIRSPPFLLHVRHFLCSVLSLFSAEQGNRNWVSFTHWPRSVHSSPVCLALKTECGCEPVSPTHIAQIVGMKRVLVSRRHGSLLHISPFLEMQLPHSQTVGSLTSPFNFRVPNLETFGRTFIKKFMHLSCHCPFYGLKT